MIHRTLPALLAVCLAVCTSIGKAHAATEPPLLGFTHSAVMAGQPVQICLYNVAPVHRPIITAALNAFTAATNAATQGHGVPWVEWCSTYSNTIMPSAEVGGGDTTWYYGPLSQVVIRYNPRLTDAWIATVIRHELMHGFWNTGHVPCGLGPSLMGPMVGCTGAYDFVPSDFGPGCRHYRPQWCGTIQGQSLTPSPTLTLTPTPVPSPTPTPSPTPAACWWGGRSWICP